MSCYHPLLAYQSKRGEKPRIIGRLTKYNYDSSEPYLRLPCGQCIGCRIDRSRDWAARIVYESTLHPYNSFLTLTYNDQHLDSSGSLNKRDIVLFFKRLRNHFPKDKIRYFQCGEYGDQLQRPHHHAIVFGLEFPDRVIWSIDPDNPLYVSEMLNKCWVDHTGESLGFCVIGKVTFDSAAYVARYIQKKINGKMAAEHYGGRLPEYVTMSRSPGIAKNWFDNYYADIYNNDRMVIHSKLKIKPSRYFDQKYDLINPGHMEDVREQRRKNAHEKFLELTPARLKELEELKTIRTKKLTRKMEAINERVTHT